MKIIYEKETDKKRLTYEDVAQNQFFVCRDGYLCQKRDYTRYVTIADDEGNPSCDLFYCTEDLPIKRLLPRVEKIEF